MSTLLVVSRSHYSGGRTPRWIICDMGVHHFALLQDWFGLPEAVSASAAHDASQPDLVGENVGVVCLQYANGLRGVVINNWSYRGTWRRGTPTEEVVIQGANGAISATSEDGEVVTLHPEGSRRLAFSGHWFPDAFGASMLELLHALSEGRVSRCHGRGNLGAIAVIEAAYRSIAERGRSVALREVSEMFGALG